MKIPKRSILITLSRVFPKNHPRKGEPTDFKAKLAEGTLRHTIRGSYYMWVLNAEKLRHTERWQLSVRQWQGQPYRSKQEEIGIVNHPIGVEPLMMHYHADTDTITAKIDTQPVPITEIAKNNGLTLDEFTDWYFAPFRHKQDFLYCGAIIHFTDYRYIARDNTENQ